MFVNNELQGSSQDQRAVTTSGGVGCVDACGQKPPSAQHMVYAIAMPLGSSDPSSAKWSWGASDSRRPPDTMFSSHYMVHSTGSAASSMRSPRGAPQSYSPGNSSVRAVPPAGRVSSSGVVDAWAAADPDIQRQTYYDKDTYMFPDSMRPKKSEGALPNYLELHKKSLLAGAVRPDRREAAGPKVIGTERAVQDACQLVQ